MLALVASGYSVVYFLTYNILHYDRVLPFPEENDKNLSLFIYNIIPILILTALNYGIIFGIRLPGTHTPLLTARLRKCRLCSRC